MASGLIAVKRPFFTIGITMLCTLQLCLRTEPVYVGTAAVLLSAAAAVFVYFLRPAGKTLCVISLAALLAVTVYSAELHGRMEPSALTGGENLQITGTLADYPQKKNNQYVYILKDCTRNGIPVSENIRVSTREIPQCIPGDTMTCRNITVSGITDNDYLVSSQPMLYRIYLQAYGSDVSVTHNHRSFFAYPIQNLRHMIQTSLQENLSEEKAQILNGLLIGSTADMDDELLQTFRRSGIAHLFAVSGLHVSFWTGMVIRLFGKRKYHTFFLTLTGLFTLCFMALTGFSPSVCRAGLSAVNQLLCCGLHRHSDGRNALGFSMTVILCINPCAADNASLLLSSGAALVLLLAASPLEDILTPFTERHIRIPVLQKTASYLLLTFALSVAVSTALMPLFARFFGCASMLSPLTNILCCVPAEWAMVTGAFALFLHPVPLLSGLLCTVTEWLLQYITKVCALISGISFASVEIEQTPILLWFIITAAVMALLYCVCKNKVRTMLSAGIAGLCSLLLLLNIYEYRNRDTLYFTVYPCYRGILAEVHDRHGNAAVFGCGASYSAIQSVRSNLNKCGIDGVRLLILPQGWETSTQLLLTATAQLRPETTVADSGFSEELVSQENIRFAQSGTVCLWDDITISFSFDSDGKSVILEKGDTRIVLVFDGDPPARYRSGNILLTRQTVPDTVSPDDFGEIIFSSVVKEEEFGFAPTLADKIITTADEGIIRRTYREEQWQS